MVTIASKNIFVSFSCSEFHTHHVKTMKESA
jgi:hypothetical protein